MSRGKLGRALRALPYFPAPVTRELHRRLAALVAELLSALARHVLTCRIESHAAAAGRADLVVLPAVFAVQQSLVLLLAGFDLLFAAVIEDACVGNIEWLCACHANCFLTGRTTLDSLERVGRVRGSRPPNEAATLAVDAQVGIEALRRYGLIVALEDVVVDVVRVCCAVDVYWTAVHPRREDVFLMYDAADDSVQTVAACPDAVNEDRIVIWCLELEDVLADIAFSRGGGHLVGRLWRVCWWNGVYCGGESRRKPSGA